MGFARVWEAAAPLPPGSAPWLIRLWAVILKEVGNRDVLVEHSARNTHRDQQFQCIAF